MLFSTARCLRWAKLLSFLPLLLILMGILQKQAVAQDTTRISLKSPHWSVSSATTLVAIAGTPYFCAVESAGNHLVAGKRFKEKKVSKVIRSYNKKISSVLKKIRKRLRRSPNATPETDVKLAKLYNQRDALLAQRLAILNCVFPNSSSSSAGSSSSANAGGQDGQNSSASSSSSPPAPPDRCLSLTMYGITWQFEQPHPCGFYVTGDPWIVGPLTVTAISFADSDVEPPACGADARSGSMVNPRFGRGGYDGRAGGSFDASLCRAAPISLQAGDSLVTIASFITPPDGVKTDAKLGAVLTVVDAPQSAETFRPPYTRPNRIAQSAADPLRFSTSRMQWSKLLSLATVPDTPDIYSTLRSVQRPWIDHFAGWEGYKFMPRENMPDYGREIAQTINEAALQVLLNYPPSQKQPVAIALTQIGIDFYGSLLDGGEWNADGGIFQGRKWPILFAGIMLDDSGMKGIGTTHYRTLESDGSYRYTFQEDGQTYLSSDPTLPSWIDDHGLPAQPGAPGAFPVRNQVGWVGLLNDQSSSALWRIIDAPGYAGRVTQAYEHMHAQYWLDDYEDPFYNPMRAESYRRCCTSVSFVGTALVARLMNAQTLWNHSPFFDYVDRWMNESDERAVVAYFVRQGGNENYFQSPTVSAVLVSGLDYSLMAPTGWSGDPQEGDYLLWHYTSGSSSRLARVLGPPVGNMLPVRFESPPGSTSNVSVILRRDSWFPRQRDAAEGAAGGGSFIDNMWHVYR